MSNCFCVSERTTRTVSIYAHGIFGGFMNHKDRAIIAAWFYWLPTVLNYFATLWYNTFTAYAEMNREFEQRRNAMLSYQPHNYITPYTAEVLNDSEIGLPLSNELLDNTTETDTPNAYEIDLPCGEVATISHVQRQQLENGKVVRQWVEAVLDYCEQHGTERYIEDVLKIKATETLPTVTLYRKTMRGKSVRYVECSKGEKGETLYMKKGKRYIVAVVL